MKLSRYNVNILVSELDALSKLQEDVVAACLAWMKAVNERDAGGTNEWLAKGYRERLESLLTEYRAKQSVIYDFMGDRGMVNFEPTGYAEELGVEDVSRSF